MSRLTAFALIAELGVLGGSWALVGWQLLPRSVRGKLDLLLRWTIALALGCGLTAVALTALAGFHLLGANSVRLLTGLEAAAAVAIAVVHRRELVPGVRVRLSGTRSEKVALAILGLILLLTFVATCAPPSAMDATVYHLPVPDAFLRTGTWTKLDQVQSFQPLYVEMLFAQALVIGGGPLAALVHWLLGIAAIGTSAGWARRFGASRVWGAVIFGGSALWVWESTSPFIDLGLALFASLALLLAVSVELGSAGAVLAGACAGLAGGSKFTGLALALLAAGVALLRGWQNRKRAVKSFLVLGGVALVVAAPWYVRNFILTGNPVFPLANRAFGLRPEPLAGITYGFGTDLLHLLSSPFDLLVRGDKFDQGWATGPAYLALAPLGLVFRRSREAALVAGYAAAWWLIWFYSSPQTRLLIPILPPAAGLAAAAVDELLASRHLALCGLTAVVLAVQITAGLLTSALYAGAAAPVVFGLESTDAYLRRNSWNYGLYKSTEVLLDPAAQVAVTGLANNLYYFHHQARWLGKDPVSTNQLAAAGFQYELRVSVCPMDPLDEPHRLVLKEGTYSLRASRLAGGIYAQACFRLSTVSPAAARAAP